MKDLRNLKSEKTQPMRLFKLWPAKKAFALSATSLVLMALACLFPLPKPTGGGALAESGSQDPSISISASGLLNLTLAAGGLPNTASATITTATTNYTGYKLYFSAKDENTSMVIVGGTPNNPNDTIESIESSIDPYTSGNGFENRWGYKVDSAEDTYDPIPKSSARAQIGDYTTASSGNNTTLTIAAKAGATRAQGTYVGELTLTAMPNPSKYYSVTYNKNTSETVSNFPSNISETSTTNPTITLASATPARANYVFVGWCATATTDGATCPGTLYSPSSVITLDATTANTINIYAVWKSAIYEITLDNQSATTAGTGTIYETYGSKYSLTSGGTATTAITKPARSYTYTISYDANSQGASYTGSPTSATRTDTFNGYYTAKSGGTQLINNSGTITAANTYFTANSTIYAQWTNGVATFDLPAISKTGYTCKWNSKADGTGNNYDSEQTGVTIAADTTFYAVCTTNLSLFIWQKNNTINNNVWDKYDVNVGGYVMGASPVASGITVQFQSGISSSSNTPTVDSETGEFSLSNYTTPSGSMCISYASQHQGRWFLSDDKTSSAISSAAKAKQSSGKYAAKITSAGIANISSCKIVVNVYQVELGSTKGSTHYGTVYAPANTYPKDGTPDNVYWYTLINDQHVYEKGTTDYGMVASTSSDTYPDNGRHTDGYWYTKITLDPSSSSVLYYDANGGTNVPNADIFTQGTPHAFTLNTSEIPTRNGYAFMGYATSSTATTPDYAYNGSAFSPSTISVTSFAALYAVWKPAYTITLNNQSATTAGTSTIYEIYDTRYSLTSSGPAMTTTNNSITIPQKTYRITYNANNQRATYSTNGKTSSPATFSGYYTATDGGGAQYIDAAGYITSSASNTYFTSNGVLYAKWTDNSMTLPTITKTNANCHWHTNSSGNGGTPYESGQTIDISSNLTLYALCVSQ